MDVFEEVFKLIFTKLYDEWLSGKGNNKNTRCLEFRNTGQTETALKNKIQKLFDDAKKKWEGVFSEDSKITLTPSHLSVCVSSLENVKLFNSNLDVVDEAFEYLINKSSKGEKGQFFTPRYVIDMCVKMLNPKEDEYIIDTAAGSSGFTVHTIFHVWKQILEDEGISASHLFSLEDKPYRCTKYVEEKVFAIDFDEKAVRVARTLNLIAGDGETNVLHLNTLDFDRWDDWIKQEDWIDIYNQGFKRLKKLQTEKNSYQKFNFDVLMANPPFAGDIKESRLIQKYDLSVKDNGKRQTKMGRDILFIERNLDFLKSGGRMAIVLPQGRFNNSSDKYIRDYIAERCRILAVIGLHGNTFKPHTGTKTSVLLVQKWDDKLCPKVEDYNIFFATMRKSGKDNSGEKIYSKNSNGEFILDSHNHLIVDHDLFNHDGLTEDGIAEAFIEFAKKEGLSFFDLSLSINSFDAVKYHALMDRLEAVELKLSDVLKHNQHFRYDAEYYKKEYIKLDQLLRLKNSVYLESCCNSIINFGAYSLCNQIEYLEKGVPYLNVSDIKDNIINIDNTKLISESVSKNILHKSLVKDNQVLLTIAGTIGNCAVAYNLPEATNSNQAIANLNIKANISPFYVSTFLNSKIGKSQTTRLIISNVQPNLLLTQVKSILIFIANSNFQYLIEKTVKFAHQFLNNSKQLYQEAEELLLTELGLKDWQPTEDNITVKSFSSSFVNSGRLDAEYYQPKYDQLISKIVNNQYLKLGNIVNIKKSIEPGSDAYSDNGIPFIRVSNLSKEGISDTDIYIPENLIENIEKLKPKKDTIFLTKDGSIGIAYKVDRDLDIITSSAILHLTIKKNIELLPDYLTLVLNSIITKLQSERDSGGSIIQHWRISEIEQILVPIINLDLQTIISDKIKESFKLRVRSKQLLEIAKKGVEKAIESDEETAIKWINEELEKIGVSLK